MSKLIIIDWGGVTHRAIFAYRNNRQIPFTYTMLRMVIGYLKRISITLDDKILCAEDYGSWRKEIDKEYKAQRKAFRESKEDASFWTEVYKEANDFTEKLSQCLPFSFIKLYHMEADDIASCAIRFINAEEKILITSDADWEQLCVFPNVKIFSIHNKKFKIVKNPEKILLKKIHGDVSDNLLTVPKTEAEFEKRRMIVDLINLPSHIDNIIRPVIQSLPIKNLYLHKIPYKSCAEEIKKLYRLED